MQSIRNGGYNLYNYNNQKKQERLLPNNEKMSIQLETPSKFALETHSQPEDRAIAGEAFKNKPPCEQCDDEFMKLKIEKLEEEIKILRKEIDNLVDIILNRLDNANLHKETTNNESHSKAKSKNFEKKSPIRKKTELAQKEKRNVKDTNKNQMELKDNVQIKIEQNKKIEEIVQLIKNKKFNEALTLIDTYLKEENDITRINVLYYWKGEALFYTKEYSRAIECFQKVLSFPRSNKKVESQIMIAECYTKLGKLNEAKREYQKFIEAYPFSEFTPRAKRMIQQL